MPERAHFYFDLISPKIIGPTIFVSLISKLQKVILSLYFRRIFDHDQVVFRHFRGEGVEFF